MKILFFLRSLDYGGAERQLVLLARGLRECGHDVLIAVFYPGGPLEKELEDSGVRIRPLHKRGRWDVVQFFLRLIRVLREEHPDILHSYLFEPNLVALAVKPLFPAMRVVWGIRSSMMDFSRYDWLAGVSFKLSGWLSRLPDAVIINSRIGREYHVSKGFAADKMVVIPNGVDTERFRPDPAGRARIRSEWGIAACDKLVGLVGRLDPMKDHPIFLQAAALLAHQRRDTRFVCVGGGPAEYRASLRSIAKSLGLEDCLLWVDTRTDMADIYNALDVSISSSYGEGLSNVIVEAMACGVPCVVTDVGDSAWIVGDTGEVVPPKNAMALMDAIQRSLDRPRCAPARIRQRIVEQLSEDNLVGSTERTLSRLLSSSLTACHLSTP